MKIRYFIILFFLSSIFISLEIKSAAKSKSVPALKTKEKGAKGKAIKGKTKAKKTTKKAKAKKAKKSNKVQVMIARLTARSKANAAKNKSRARTALPQIPIAAGLLDSWPAGSSEITQQITGEVINELTADYAKGKPRLLPLGPKKYGDTTALVIKKISQAEIKAWGAAGWPPVNPQIIRSIARKVNDVISSPSGEEYKEKKEDLEELDKYKAWYNFHYGKKEERKPKKKVEKKK